MATTTVKNVKGKSPQQLHSEKLQREISLLKRAVSHRQRSAQTAEAMVGAPVAFGKTRRNSFVIRAHPRFKDAVVIEGQEYLSPLTVPAAPNNNQPGAILGGGEIYISPFEFAGTRIEQFAKLYEKFRFTKFEFEYVPALPTVQQGSVVMAYDRDIQDATPPPNRDGIRQLCAFEGAQYGPVWKPFKVDCNLQAPETGFYTSPGVDDRLCYQGQVYVATMEPTGLSAGAVVGDLLMRYVCELFVPQLESTLPNSTVNASSSVAPLVTDVLRQYAVANSAVPTQGSEPSLIPLLDTALKGYVPLPEGVYQLANSLINNVAASTGLNAPTIVLNDPAPAAAPQPIIQAVAATGATPAAVGAAAQGVYLISVPRGGGKLYQTASSIGGIGGPSTSFLYRMQKLGNSYSARLLS